MGWLSIRGTADGPVTWAHLRLRYHRLVLEAPYSCNFQNASSRFPPVFSSVSGLPIDFYRPVFKGVSAYTREH